MTLNRRTFTCLFALAATVAAMPVKADEAADAEKLFDQLFASRIREVQATRDKADDHALAQELLKAAEISASHPKVVVLACESAYKLCSGDVAGYPTAIAAMDLLGKSQPEKAAECLDRVVDLRSRQFATAKADERAGVGQGLMDDLVRLADAKLAAKSPDAAVAALRRASVVASQIKSSRLEDIRARLDAAQDAQKLQTQIAKLEAELNAKQGDPGPGRELARIYVAELDDPSAAAGYTLVAADETLSKRIKLACQPLYEVPLENLLDLGEWYRGLSDGAQGQTGKRRCLTRAKFYLERFIKENKATDLTAAKSQLLQSAVNASLVKLGGAVTTSLKTDAPAAPVVFTPTTPRPGTPPTAGGDDLTAALDKARAGEKLSLAFGHDGIVRVWDASQWAKIRDLDVGKDKIKQIVIMPNNQFFFATTEGDNEIRMLHNGGSEWGRLTGHSQKVNSVIPWGASLAVSADQGGTVNVWEINGKRVLKTLSGHKGPVIKVQGNFQQQRIFTASHDRKVLVFDLRTGDVVKTLYVDDMDSVGSMAVSEDGKYVLTGSKDGAVRLWDVEKGKVVHKMEGHSSTPHMVAFSADMKWAISRNSYGDRSLRVWDLTTGREQYRIDDAKVDARTISMNGGNQMAVTFDGTTATWWRAQRVFPPRPPVPPTPGTPGPTVTPGTPATLGPAPVAAADLAGGFEGGTTLHSMKEEVVSAWVSKNGTFLYGKSGKLGSMVHIRINKIDLPNSLAIFPDNKKPGQINYDLEGKYRTLTGAAGINDIGQDPYSDITFRIVGDGKDLWTSKPTRQRGKVQPFVVNVTGVKKLELVVNCDGNNGFANSVWVEPRVHEKEVKPVATDPTKGGNTFFGLPTN